MLVSPFLERQIPFHVRRDYPLFVTFLQYYYEYLEQNAYPAEIISRFQTLRDAHVNPDYVTDLAEEIFHALPGQTQADKINLLYRSQDYFRSKGSENALLFIYRVVFGTDITLSYPGNDILIASEGRWKAWDAIEVLGDASAETALTQATSGATADVVDVTLVEDRTSSLALTDLVTDSLTSASEVEGDWRIWTNTGSSMSIVTIQTGSPVPVLDTSLYAAIKPVFELYGGIDPTVQAYDEDTAAYVALTADVNGYYDISALTGPVSSFKFTTTENQLALKSVTLLHSPLSVIEVENVTGTFDSSHTVNGFTPLTALTEKDGYLDRLHLISETAKILDGNLISEFSYRIDGISRKQVRENGPALRKLIHPAGFAGFYRYDDNYLSAVPVHFSMDEAGSYTYGPFDLTDPDEELTLAWTDDTATTVTITITFHGDGSPSVISSSAFTSGGTVTPPDGALTMDVEIAYVQDAGEILTFTGLSLVHTAYLDDVDAEWHEEV